MVHPVLWRRACAAMAVLAVVSWGASASAQPELRVRASAKKYALLVAVDRYGGGTLLPGLTYPQRDIEGLAEVLADSGYARDDLVVMTRKSGGEEFDLLPVAAHIRNQLALLLKLLKPGDTVLVVLCGHGVMMDAPPPGGGKPVATSFFCPMDANLKERDLTKFIAFDEFFAGLAASKATTKLLLVDACRNELKMAPDSRAQAIETAPPPPPPPSVAALYACSEQEVSWEDASLGGGHGVFSHFVIEGLKGQADENGDRNGATTLNELTEYVQENVFRFVRKRHSVSQEPRLVASGVGRVVLRDAARVRAADLITSRATDMKLKLIPSGEFLMGSSKADDRDAYDNEQPQHRVRITRPFYLGVTEVTVGQFRKVVESTGLRTEAETDGKGALGWNEAKASFEQNPSVTWRNPGFAQTDEHPVVNVSWNDAIAFCNKLSELEGLKPYYGFGVGAQSGGDGYRLPTEAQWEYACRARTTTRYQSGDDAETLAEVGNVADATLKAKGGVFSGWTAIVGRDGYVFTAPVGRFRPNAFGLYDMHGNVWEWCWDGYNADYYKESPAADPLGPSQAADRVLRGGGWDCLPLLCRSARRFRNSPGSRDFHLGFRVARVQSGTR